MTGSSALCWPAGSPVALYTSECKFSKQTNSQLSGVAGQAGEHVCFREIVGFEAGKVKGQQGSASH